MGGFLLPSCSLCARRFVHCFSFFFLGGFLPATPLSPPTGFLVRVPLKLLSLIHVFLVGSPSFFLRGHHFFPFPSWLGASPPGGVFCPTNLASRIPTAPMFWMWVLPCVPFLISPLDVGASTSLCKLLPLESVCPEPFPTPKHSSSFFVASCNSFFFGAERPIVGWSPLFHLLRHSC